MNPQYANYKFGENLGNYMPLMTNMVSTQDVVKHIKACGLPMALRTLNKYSNMGLIPHPMVIGNKGYYNTPQIFIRLEYLFMLRLIMRYSLKAMKPKMAVSIDEMLQHMMNIKAENKTFP
jgi:hypothetical protein